MPPYFILVLAGYYFTMSGIELRDAVYGTEMRCGGTAAPVLLRASVEQYGTGSNRDLPTHVLCDLRYRHNAWRHLPTRWPRDIRD